MGGKVKVKVWDIKIPCPECGSPLYSQIHPDKMLLVPLYCAKCENIRGIYHDPSLFVEAT